MYYAKRFRTVDEARGSGLTHPSGARADAGDIVIVDGDSKPVPGERLYGSHEKSVAEERCEHLTREAELADVPNIFDDIDPVPLPPDVQQRITDRTFNAVMEERARDGQANS